MLFDQAHELPVATIRRDRDSAFEVFASDVWRWFATRWQWLRPRMIPVAVAFVGMLAVIQAVNYLARPPAQIAPPEAAMSGAIFVDGKPYLNGTRLPDLEPSGYRVRVIVQR